MKSDVFFVKAAPTARGDKKNLDAQIKDGLQASFVRNAGSRYAGHTVTADISSNFQKALVTVVYDEAANPPATQARSFGK